MKKNTKREGFTLVELLIVIVVIGVLSAMMMLSSTEAVSSAKAADIVSDLRNLKTAALAWYADNLDEVDTTTNFNFGTTYGTDDKRKPVLKYMNNDDIDKGYKFSQNDKKEWYVYYDQSENNGGKQLTDAVKAKLKSRAKSTGLLGSAVSNDTYGVTNSENVYMFIR